MQGVGEEFAAGSLVANLGHGLVELLVLLVRDVVGVTQPDGVLCVEALPVADGLLCHRCFHRWGLLLLICSNHMQAPSRRCE